MLVVHLKLVKFDGWKQQEKYAALKNINDRNCKYGQGSEGKGFFDIKSPWSLSKECGLLPQAPSLVCSRFFINLPQKSTMYLV